MAQKTNKSFAKRFKLTGTGKLVRRTPGKNHYNAKQTRSELQSKKGLVEANLTPKNIINNLPHANTK